MTPLTYQLLAHDLRNLGTFSNRYNADKALFALNERAAVYECHENGFRVSVNDNWDVFPVDCKVSAALESMLAISEAERMEVMGNFCKSCGVDNPSCQCWNNE